VITATDAAWSDTELGFWLVLAVLVYGALVGTLLTVLVQKLNKVWETRRGRHRTGDRR
jgi:hypothetical protein